MAGLPTRSRFRPAWVLVACWVALVGLRAGELRLRVMPQVSGEPVQAASLRYETGAGESYSITRFSMLLSGFAVQRVDGSWSELPDAVAWMDLEENRNLATLGPFPDGDIRSLRFRVGLPADVNHADPAKYPATHPLNPNLNHLHWSWQGGYIFLALEGMTRPANGILGGWAFHLARDTNAVQVTVPVTATIASNATVSVSVDLDLGLLFNAPRPISFATDGTSTHSRDGDPLSAALTTNLRGAFRVRQTRSGITNRPATTPSPKPLYLPTTHTPFRFRFSPAFPTPELPPDNPLIRERVQLGWLLFHDPLLSGNGRQACVDCHDPKRAFTDGLRVSVGAEAILGRRNAMPLFNLAWKRQFFWDGRSPRLRDQVLNPIQDPTEMHQSLERLPQVLSRKYGGHFLSAFDNAEITAEKVALALEAYLLTLTSYESKWDHVLQGKDTFTALEQRGLELFSTEYDPRRGQFGADCFHCHGGPLFQSQEFGNNGLELRNGDLGRAEVTHRDADRGKFAVPSLRNVALTAPYMHDGRFRTLEEVVHHYTHGIQRSPTLDPNLAKHPDGGVPLSEADERALVAFLNSLTDLRPQLGEEYPREYEHEDYPKRPRSIPGRLLEDTLHLKPVNP